MLHCSAVAAAAAAAAAAAVDVDLSGILKKHKLPTARAVYTTRAALLLLLLLYMRRGIRERRTT